MGMKISSGIEKCDDCLGCLRCGKNHCIYNSKGNFENCYYPICKYCNDNLHKPRMMLNNLG